MPRSFQLEIITPTRVLDLGPVNYLRAPSLDGLFGIMARHTRAMISLEVGEVKVVKEGKPQYYATNGGYADIHGNSVQLLVETAEEAGEIDVERAKSAAERARGRIRSRETGIDEARAEIALKRALNRLGIAGRR
ncbi:MAG: ATP synthase F1 subunit epsilon [Fidelibacterota bacterium]|nr:MAG: ATP synthase F1 subunit epsilon [Candidatus Neomarinimicrobiota bacterium]